MASSPGPQERKAQEAFTTVHRDRWNVEGRPTLGSTPLKLLGPRSTYLQETLTHISACVTNPYHV